MQEGQFFAVFAGEEILLFKDIQRGQRQDDQHQNAEDGVADEQRDVCAERCAGQRSCGAEHSQMPIDIAGERIFGGGNRCAHGGGELIGGDTGMHRQTADQIGGKGDQAAAAGEGIDKACNAHQRADDQEVQKREFHGEVPFAEFNMMDVIIQGKKKGSRSNRKPDVARNAYFDTGLCFETFGLSIVILPRFR